MLRTALAIVAMGLSIGWAQGCALALGAGNTGAASEYRHNNELQQLERDFEAGKISRAEYLRRKKLLEKGTEEENGGYY